MPHEPANAEPTAPARDNAGSVELGRAARLCIWTLSGIQWALLLGGLGWLLFG